MALLYFDGFETYENYGDLSVVQTEKIAGITSNASAAWMSFADAGRNAGRCITLDYAALQDFHFNISLRADYATLIVGFAVKVHSGEDYPWYSRGLLIFKHGSTIHTNLTLDANRRFCLYRGDGVLMTTASVGSLPVNTWRYVQVKTTISNSAGSYLLKVGDETAIDISGVDTCNGATEATNNVQLGCPAQITYSIVTDFDDLYICDTTGTKNNDFLGDVRCDALFPDGAGTYANFTPSAGANYENVDEAVPDDDTTYNESSTIGHQDSYALDALSVPNSTTIHGVKSQITARKTDATARVVKTLTRAGTTDQLGAVFSLSDDYTTFADVHENNPDDAAAWEDADVNGMEVGLEVIS